MRGLLVTSTLLFLCACGSAQRPRGPSADELRTIHEQRAFELIQEVLDEAGVRAEHEWQIDIGAPEPLDVDVRLGGTEFGIEWVSPQDREDYREAIPPPDPEGLLRILPGAGDDAQAQILVMHERMYRYDPDRERVQRGSTGVHEVEARVRTYVRDYLEYVRGQGAL